MDKKDRQIKLLKDKLHFYERYTGTKLRYFSSYEDPSGLYSASKSYQLIHGQKEGLDG